MKTSEAFKQTLKFLWDGKRTNRGYRIPGNKSEFICIAADMVGYYEKNVIDNVVYDIVRPIMRNLLAEHSILETWILANHPEDGMTANGHPDLTVEQFNRKMQITRRAWVMSLIAEYEAKGD